MLRRGIALCGSSSRMIRRNRHVHRRSVDLGTVAAVQRAVLDLTRHRLRRGRKIQAEPDKYTTPRYRSATRRWRRCRRAARPHPIGATVASTASSGGAQTRLRDRKDGRDDGEGATAAPAAPAGRRARCAIRSRARTLAEATRRFRFHRASMLILAAATCWRRCTGADRLDQELQASCSDTRRSWPGHLSLGATFSSPVLVRADATSVVTGWSKPRV